MNSSEFLTCHRSTGIKSLFPVLHDPSAQQELRAAEAAWVHRYKRLDSMNEKMANQQS